MAAVAELQAAGGNCMPISHRGVSPHIDTTVATMQLCHWTRIRNQSIFTRPCQSRTYHNHQDDDLTRISETEWRSRKKKTLRMLSPHGKDALDKTGEILVDRQQNPKKVRVWKAKLSSQQRSWSPTIPGQAKCSFLYSVLSELSSLREPISDQGKSLFPRAASRFRRSAWWVWH